jgi:hypothetical protein
MKGGTKFSLNESHFSLSFCSRVNITYITPNLQVTRQLVILLAWLLFCEAQGGWRNTLLLRKVAWTGDELIRSGAKFTIARSNGHLGNNSPTPVTAAVLQLHLNHAFCCRLWLYAIPLTATNVLSAVPCAVNADIPTQFWKHSIWQIGCYTALWFVSNSNTSNICIT